LFGLTDSDYSSFYTGLGFGLKNDANTVIFELSTSVEWDMFTFLGMVLPILSISIINDGFITTIKNPILNVEEHSTVESDFLNGDSPENLNEDYLDDLIYSTYEGIDEDELNSFISGSFWAFRSINLCLILTMVGARSSNVWILLVSMILIVAIAAFMGLIGLADRNQGYFYIGYGYHLFIWGLSLVLISLIPGGGIVAGILRDVLNDIQLAPLGLAIPIENPLYWLMYALIGFVELAGLVIRGGGMCGRLFGIMTGIFLIAFGQYFFNMGQLYIIED